ncbi:borealin-like [Venturia canescens]|uniref:borealin-like n=1 Tax=Venturia canescens TaxID=32260 RepID=UPI001C9D1C67|nr:borealin-like [Venturia canescens]
MVRTKQPRKTRSMREATEESDSLVKDFERQALQRIHKAEADMSMQINMISSSIDVALGSLPTDIRKLTLGELLALNMNNEDEIALETTDPSSEISSVSRTVQKPKKVAKRVTAASDDGYATESTTAAKTHVSRINSITNSANHQLRKHRSSSTDSNTLKKTTRTTRSVSRNRNSKLNADSEQEDRNNLLKTAGRCPPSSQKYKTPSTKNQVPFYSVITPKIKPNTPLNMMRRPRQGEMVLSMQGSPLLVSTVEERTANINVPLQNGDIISLLPNPGLRLSHLPAVDDETMQQLRTLNGHLNKVMGHK